MATHSSIIAWKIPRTGSLVGYSPWDHKESDTPEVTEHTHPRGLVLRTLPSSAGGVSLIPGQRANIPHTLQPKAKI